jgi:hypothetical protein
VKTVIGTVPKNTRSAPQTTIPQSQSRSYQQSPPKLLRSWKEVVGLDEKAQELKQEQEQEQAWTVVKPKRFRP